MAEISKIKLPSGNVYEFKDQTARDLISQLASTSYFLGVTTTVLSDGATTNPIVIGGENVTAVNGNMAVNGSAEFIYDGAKWLLVGDLSQLGALAYKDTVSLAKGSGDNVLGEATTFKNAASSVSFSGGSTDSVMGADTTFATTVTPTTTRIKATASGTAVGADGTAAAITGFGAHSTDTFVKSVSAETNKKLVTTTVPNVTGNDSVTIPNVTSAGAASTWGFAMGTGADAETLIISGGNGTAPTLGTALSASKVTLGTAKTVATGAATTSGTGAAVVTGVTIGESAAAITALGTPTTASCLTGVKVTAQPTVALATGAASATGVVQVATGITSASTIVDTADPVTAITGLGTATAAAQTITVGTNDKVKVAKFDDLSVSAS